jgi:hypothetical protein
MITEMAVINCGNRKGRDNYDNRNGGDKFWQQEGLLLLKIA